MKCCGVWGGGGGWGMEWAERLGSVRKVNYISQTLLHKIPTGNGKKKKERRREDTSSF